MRGTFNRTSLELKPLSKWALSALKSFNRTSLGIETVMLGAIMMAALHF